jgi:ribonuclease HI
MKLNIKRRNIKLDTACPVCKRFDEDGAHCFLKCKRARHCWRELQLESVRGMLLDIQSSEEFVAAILALNSEHVVLLWKLWDARNRNKDNAGESSLTCSDVVCAVYSMLSDIQSDNVPLASPVRIRDVWTPPEPELLKINIDGAFKECSTGACGFIIHHGEPVLAGAANISPALDVLATETVACLFALESAERHGISRIELETDSSQLREAIRSMSRDLAPGGVLFKCIRELLHNSFRCTKVSNVPRLCNSSAHKIAKLALSWDLGHSSLWSDPLPEFVFDLVARDTAELNLVNTRP